MRVFKGELEGDLEGDLKGNLNGDLKGDFEVDLEVDLEGDFRGDFKQDLEGDSSSGQLRSSSGLVQVWFSIELKFNSFELDSEVGRLVHCNSYITSTIRSRALRRLPVKTRITRLFILRWFRKHTG